MTAFAVTPATACIASGATQQFSVAGGLSVTWSVNGVVGGNSTFGTISSTGLYTAPLMQPNPPVVTVSAASASLTVGTALVDIEKALRLFTITTGGAGTNYTGISDSYGNPINVEYSTTVLSEVIPATNKWVVRDSNTSVSYASSTYSVWKQDHQIFGVTIYSSQCAFRSYFDPLKTNIVQFGLYFFGGPDSGACDLSHVAIAGDNVYWRRPSWNDIWGWNGGQFIKQSISSGSSTTLFLRTDTDNQAAADLGDSGKLFSIRRWGSPYWVMGVWVRDLTTGKLGEVVGAYDTYFIDSYVKWWSYAIDEETLYVLVVRSTDGAAKIYTADLRDPYADLILQKEIPTSLGTFGYRWGADSGHVTVAVYPPGSSKMSRVVDYDTATGQIKYYDLGSTTSILALHPVWM